MATLPAPDPRLTAMLDAVRRAAPAGRVATAADYCINLDATRALAFLNRLQDVLGIEELGRLLARLRPDSRFSAYSSRWLDLLDRLPRSPHEECLLADPDADFITPPAAASADALVCCFCGNSRRLMFPLHFVDGYFSAFDADVLYIRPAAAYFGEAATGFFDGALRRIDALLEAGRYGRLYCIGTSAGGVPAQLAGYLLGARRTLSIGAGLAAGGFDPAGAYGDRPRLPAGTGFNLVGESHEGDHATNRELASRLGTETLVLAGTAKHCLVHDLIRADTWLPLLRWWLEELASDALPPSIRHVHAVGAAHP